MFPYSNRVMHIEQKPEEMFPGEQGNTRNCSEAGKYFKKKLLEIYLHKFIRETLELNPLEKKIQDPKLSPITYRHVNGKTIFFNSRFESGNLREVERVKDSEYDLYLSFDHNTLNYT
jgi:hypothetical protein